jgi:hypothetical protein
MAAYLSRTPASSGSQRIFTYSAWVKKCDFSSGILLSSGESDGDPNFAIYFDSSSRLNILFYSGASTVLQYITNRVFRDVSAWYHIVVKVDTTQATASDRVQLYVNGVEETSFSTETDPSQNTDISINTSSYRIAVGAGVDNGDTFDGYMSEVVFIDGQQLTPSSFGETDSTTNNWVPKDVSGLTFGTNGFYLRFQNASALGQDDSGNGNNFTVNNITSIDQTVDTCTNNFCTLDPNNASSNCSLADGNTEFGQSANDSGVTGNLGFTQGKWYWEFKVVGGLPEGGIILNPMVKSFAALSTVSGTVNNTTLFRIFNNTGATSNFRAMGSTVNTTVGASVTYAVGDIISVAVDADAGKIWFAKNGTYEGGGNPATGTSPTYDWSSNLSSIDHIVPGFLAGTGTSAKQQCNFGNPAFSISSGNTDYSGLGNFEYEVPEGYRALCTKNIGLVG